MLNAEAFFHYYFTMWYIYLKDSNLSEDSIKSCVQNNIHTLQNLMDQYQADQDFSKLSFLSEKSKREILEFCDDVLHYFRSYFDNEQDLLQAEIPNTNEANNDEFESLNSIKENYTIEELYKEEFISKKVYQALIMNNLDDLNELYRYYINYGTFATLRNIGNLKNTELLQLVNRYHPKDSVDIQKRTNTKVLFEEDCKLDPEFLLEFLNLWKLKLKGVVYDHLKKEIIKTKNDSELLKSVLNQIYKSPESIKGFGSQKGNLVKKFLEEYKELITASESYRINRYSHLKLFHSDKFKLSDEKLNELDWSYPLKSFKALLDSSKRIKELDRFILENVRTCKITEVNEGLTYEKTREKASELFESEITTGVIKARTNRAKEKLVNEIDYLINEIPALAKAFDNLFKLKGEFVLVDSEKLHHLNEMNGTNFSNYLFNLIYTIYNKGYWSIFDLSGQFFCELSYISKKIVRDQQKFKTLIRSLRDKVNYHSSREKTYSLESQDVEFINSTQRLNYLKNLLVTHNPQIQFEDNYFTVPPAYDGRTPLIYYIVEVIREYGKAIHYDELIKRFDRKYPNIERNSYRSLRDAMSQSELTTPLGGSSNYYILQEWESNYKLGPYKTLILEYFEQQGGIQHYFEVYRNISKDRPDLRLENVLATLLMLKDTFRSHDGGFYSLKKDNINNVKYRRVHSGVHKIIRKNKKLVDDPTILTKILKDHYPYLEEIQLEFVISQFEE